MDLEPQPEESILESPDHIYLITSSCLLQYLQTFHIYDRWLSDGIRSCAYAAQCEQRHAVMWLSLPDLLIHQT